MYLRVNGCQAQVEQVNRAVVMNLFWIVFLSMNTNMENSDGALSQDLICPLAQRFEVQVALELERCLPNWPGTLRWQGEMWRDTVLRVRISAYILCSVLLLSVEQRVPEQARNDLVLTVLVLGVLCESGLIVSLPSTLCCPSITPQGYFQAICSLYLPLCRFCVRASFSCSRRVNLGKSIQSFIS